MHRVTIEGSPTISGIFDLGTSMDEFIKANPDVQVLNTVNGHWEVSVPTFALAELIVALYHIEQPPMSLLIN